MLTILIADDHRMIRDTWSDYLSRDTRFDVIGKCSNSKEAVELSAILRPDILLIDINMEPFSGIEATRQVRTASPETQIIAVTLHDKVEIVERILFAGATGYVSKNSSVKELKMSILEAAEGRLFISSDIKARLAEETHGPDRLTLMNLLTARENEIIKFLKAGLSTIEISKALNISTHTVDTHRHNILQKLNVKNAASLIELVHASELYK